MFALLWVITCAEERPASLGMEMTPKHSEECVRLFNGRDLTNFYTFLRGRGRNADPNGVFRVENGELHISGEEWGCVTTEQEFENYHLITEFRWGEKTHPPREHNARDCGILLHSVGEDGAYGGVWMYSIECQIIEGGTGDIIVVGDGTDRFAVTCPAAPEKTGDCYVFQPDGKPVTVNSGRVNWYGRDPEWIDIKGFRGKEDVEKPAGEWNRYECIADGTELTVILNGVVVNRCLDLRPHKGRIQIQSEGAEIVFRRIDLIPLAHSKRPRRFIYNSDGDNMFIYRDPPMTPADVYAYVDEIAGTGITTVFLCPNVGMNTNYPSAISDMLGTHLSPDLAKTMADPAGTRPVSLERAAANLAGLVEAGHDPFGLLVQRAREQSFEVFASFRLNEVHAVEQPDSMLLSRFWKEHPEWRIGKAGDPLPPIYLEILGPDTHPIVASWLPGGLNFAVPEVRARRLAELRELCERYPIDGLDLDFQRFPMYFKPGEEAAGLETMTEWMREVREMTKVVGAARGRPVLLSARIMARPEQNWAIGLDPIEWIRQGVLDFVTVSHYLRNDFPLPITEYRKMLPPDFPIYASIEVAPDPNAYRRIARRLWQDGADGILLFNFFTTRERGKEPPFELLDEIGNPKTIPPEDP